MGKQKTKKEGKSWGNAEQSEQEDARVLLRRIAGGDGLNCGEQFGAVAGIIERGLTKQSRQKFLFRLFLVRLFVGKQRNAVQLT